MQDDTADGAAFVTSVGRDSVLLLILCVLLWSLVLKPFVQVLVATDQGTLCCETLIVYRVSHKNIF